MGFLSDFGGLLNDQFGIGENTSHSIDSGGQYGSLGAFKDKIDKSAERYYYEDGFIRDLRPRSRSILFQQPDIFIVVKKRMFSTLVDNSRLDLLEEKERILIAASKRLFQNKCRLISAYEKLTKIEQLTLESGRFNTYLAPQLFTLLDVGGPLFSAFGLNAPAKATLDKLRRIVAYAEPGRLTNWTTNDWDAVFGNDIGEGPGTFELTNVASVRTSVSTEWGGGSASLTLEDPHNLLTITEKDIDQALTDVTNPMRTGATFKFTDIELRNRIEELKSELAIERNKRNASQITFKVSPGTILSKRVRAILDDEGVEIEFNYSTGIQDAFNGFENADNFLEGATSVGNFFSTGSVEIAPKFLSGNDSENLGDNNQLNSSERRKFSEIIANIYTVLAQRQTSQRELKKRNAEINYARNRMRLFFNGKHIIQPMDTITIWMNSRTDEDQRLPGGFRAQQNERGVDSLQRFDTIVKNINNMLGSLRDPTGTFSKVSFDDIERLSVVGPDVPVWLWRQLRQDITAQPTGPCVFTGIVGKGNSGVSGSWNDGKWTVSVECEDNTGYFDKSQINFKPAADVFNASIYDPLTPFDVSFDAATGVPITEIGAGDFPPLLPENQLLLQSGLATLRSGENKGKVATEERYMQPSKEISFGDFRAVLHDPEGMVYRWKQGIQTLTDSSRPNKTFSIDQERTVLLTNQPFAGQDIMNVMSLLITGQPYNYGSFLKAAIANGNSLGANDELTNIAAASTYIQGLVSDIERTNLIWGNFIPHKKLTVNPAYEKFIAEQSTEIITLNANIRQKLNRRARIEDELILQLAGVIPDPSAFVGRDEQGRVIAAEAGSAVDAEGLGTARQTEISLLSDDIAKFQKEFDYTISDPLSNNPEIGLTLIGNDVISNPTLTPIDDAGSTPAQKQRDELELRRKLFRYTARRFWQVRANEDQNLFIVDDQYDKNFDIQAFTQRIGGKIEVFNSMYSNISDQLTGVSKLLGLECFANTQGHIEARPPLYNRVPSSVFYKMFQDRDELGVKVFPDFLENLYFNQIKGIFRQLEVIEDEIRLRAVALGARNDREIQRLVSGGSNVIADEAFSFLTKFDGDGKIGTQNLRALLTQSNPDFVEGLDDPGLKELSEFDSVISKQIRTSLLFPPSVQATAIANFNPNLQPDRQADIFDRIRDRLRIKTGREPKKLQDLFGNPKFRRLSTAEGTSTTVSRIDRLNVFDQIANLLSERQQIMKSVTNAIRHLEEGVSINAPDIQNENIFQGGLGNITKPSNSNKTARTLAAPYLNRKTEIPQFLEHMIEYEDEDDIGPNSGRRFVITADRIVSMTISENPPPFTMVTVKGLFGGGLLDAPSAFNENSDGGNRITSAYAVDYDMWYQYGFVASKAIEAPYLSDPDSQCAPFAVATLLEARENILQGSVEVVGYNEFYQPGDVVYIEDRNLLFYVKQVSHSFSYGKLSTTLQLTYGHSPGEYIPTMLDVVGKILYNARGFTGQFRTERSQMLGSARSIGALAFTANIVVLGEDETTRFPPGTEPIEILLRGSQGERNKKILTNALFGASGSLNQVSFRRQSTKIKIVYYKTATSRNDEMLELANAVVRWLITPEVSTSDGLQPLTSADGQVYGLSIGDILIEEVDLTNPEQKTRTNINIITGQRGDPVPNTQGPSSAAIQIGRSLDQSGLGPSEFRDLVANTVIDIFVDYTAGGAVGGQVRGQCTMSIEETDGLSESGQAANASIDAARGGRASGS